MEIDALIHQIAAGDMPAFEQLYHTLYSGVFAFVLSIVQNPAPAADITQDVFLQVHSHAQSFQSKGHGKAWVMKIARNLALNECKRKRWEPLEEQIQSLPQPGDSYALRDDVMDLGAVFSLLGKQEREIVMLRAYGYQHDEISEILRMPQGTVRWRYAKAMKKLRTQTL